MKPKVHVLVEFFNESEGGRKNPAYLNGKKYRPHLVADKSNEYLGVEFIQGPSEPIFSGIEVNAVISLLYFPEVSYKDLVIGQVFRIFEGGKCVGKGVITSSFI